MVDCVVELLRLQMSAYGTSLTVVELGGWWIGLGMWSCEDVEI